MTAGELRPGQPFVHRTLDPKKKHGYVSICVGKSEDGEWVVIKPPDAGSRNDWWAIPASDEVSPLPNNPMFG